VLLDDVGVDKLSGPSPAPTPTIDALAARGVTFPNAWGAMYCGPARIQLLTGRWSRRYGFGANPDSDGTYEVPHRERYLPALLAEAPVPYTSVAVGKWGVRDGGLPDAMRDPLDRGFRHHVGSAHNLGSYFTWKSFDDGVESERTGYATSALVDDALESLEGLPEPWLLYLAPNAAHAPLEPPPSDFDLGVTREDSAADRGDAVLSAFDVELGRLLDALPPPVRARTVVVVVGDNGSYGSTIEAPYDPDRGKGTMFEGGLRVPLVVSGPGVVEGAVSERLVDLPDVTATLLELAGLDPGSLDGTGFAAQLADPEAPGPEFAWSEYLGDTSGPPPWDREQVAVRDERFKLVSSREGEALFDLSGEALLEGADLLGAPLAPEAEEALARLRAERDRIRAEAAYEPP
jgi:arylsulfatase A-like enzyme